MEDLSLTALWASLPKLVRLSFGDDSGQAPRSEALVHLFADEADLCKGLQALGAASPDVVQTFFLIQQRAALMAERVQKRRALLYPEQRFAMAKLPRVEEQAAPNYRWLLQASGAVRTLPRLRCRVDKALLSRAAQEQRELEKWRSSMCNFLREVNMPVASQATLADNPDIALSGALGSARVSSLRKHVRECQKLKTYSLATTDSAWPRHVGVVLNYLHERPCEPCAPSVPQAFLRSLSFVERVGGVVSERRLSDLQVLRNTVQQLTMDLQTGTPPKRQAPVLPLAMIAAIEATVCDRSLSLYMRGFAFYKLLKLWAAARHSDFESLNPSSLVLTQQGLEGRLDRTKTSGPGRRVRFLPIFISRAAYLVCPQWLEVGLQIWSSAGMNFERDFFLPLPCDDWTGCKQAMASYSQVVAITKALWRSLRALKFAHGSWQFSDQRLLTSPDALSFWTEHSERNWLNSVLAALEVPREQRDFLGRWRASSSCDEYIRSARIIVMKLQSKAVNGLRRDKTGELRFLGVTELTTHLRTACKFCEEELAELESILLDSARTVPPHEASTATDRASAGAVEEVEIPSWKPPAAESAGPGDEEAPFFISVVGHRHVRRLHKNKGCPTSASN